MTNVLRPSWVPGALLLATSAGVAGVLGFVLGLRAWPLYLGLALAGLLVMGWVERLLVTRRLPPPPRSRGKLKVIQGGKNDYDLAQDDSTDNQRWLM